MSTSEEEVTAGIFNCGAPGSGDQENKCCWFKRVFSDMHSQKAGDPAMASYCDVMCDRCDVDQEAQKTLAHLKEARMTAKHFGLVACTGDTVFCTLMHSCVMHAGAARWEGSMPVCFPTSCIQGCPSFSMV